MPQSLPDREILRQIAAFPRDLKTKLQDLDRYEFLDYTPGSPTPRVNRELTELIVSSAKRALSKHYRMFLNCYEICLLPFDWILELISNNE